MMLLALALAAAGPAETTLEPLGPLVGHCWAADFTPTMRDTHCFELMYGGAHVRDRHEVVENANPIYGGETIYSVEGGAIVFTYFNSLGGIGRGTASADGALIRFKGDMRASPGKEQQRIDSEWRLEDGSYEVRSLVAGPDGRPPPGLRFKRLDPPADD